MDSFIETFHIDWKIIIAQTINFIIVLFVLYFLVIKPLKKLMGERSQNIESGLNDAKTNAELLKNTKKEYDEIILNAKKEAHIIFQEVKTEAEEKRLEILEEAKKEVTIMISNGKKVLESEKIKIVEEAKKEIVSLVVLSTEKLLESNTNEKFDKTALDTINKI